MQRLCWPFMVVDCNLNHAYQVWYYVFFPSHASVASARSLHKMLLVGNELEHAQHHEGERYKRESCKTNSLNEVPFKQCKHKPATKQLRNKPKNQSPKPQTKKQEPNNTQAKQKTRDSKCSKLNWQQLVCHLTQAIRKQQKPTQIMDGHQRVRKQKHHTAETQDPPSQDPGDHSEAVYDSAPMHIDRVDLPREWKERVKHEWYDVRAKKHLLALSAHSESSMCFANHQ